MFIAIYKGCNVRRFSGITLPPIPILTENIKVSKEGKELLLLWWNLPESLLFLLSAWANKILARFDMTNHPHRLPDSSTLPARLIHGAGFGGWGVGWWRGVRGDRRKETESDVESKKRERQTVQETDPPGFY